MQMNSRKPPAAGDNHPNAAPDTEPCAGRDAALSSMALARIEDAIRQGIAGLHQAFADTLALDKHKEVQIDRLHQELQCYKNDDHGKIAEPWIRGLIRLHDDLGKSLSALRQLPAAECTAERVLSEFAEFRDDIELLLGQHAIEPFEAPTAVFDPVCQTALRRVPAADSAEVGRIAERMRPGFARGDTVLQKERVAVFIAAAT